MIQCEVNTRSLVWTTRRHTGDWGGRRHLPRHQGLAHAAPEGPPAKPRGTSLASCEAEGDNTSLASCEARGRHPWPGRHTDGIQRAQPTLAGNKWRQQMPRTATSPQPRLRRRGERPWPGSTPLRLRRRGRQHFPGQTPTPHTCEAEGDNTSLARYYTFTSAKPRDDPGQTPHHHTATAHGSASQIQKIVHENISQIKKFFHNIKPSPSSRTSAAEGDNQY